MDEATASERRADAPPASELFEPVDDRGGPRLAIVLGNQAPGGVCPWAAAERCHHCDIGLGEGRALTDEENAQRLAWFERRYADVWPTLAHLVLYNSGSTLNPRELSPRVLEAALSFARALPRLVRCSLDAREPFVHADHVRRAAAWLGPDRRLNVILGIESADDAIRNGLLDKGMTREGIDRAVAALGAVQREALAQAPDARTLAEPGLAVNVVIGGPGTTEATAVADAVDTARYALDLAERHAVPLELNLHPYYPSARGRARFPEHPRAEPAIVLAALDAIARVVSDRALVFVGWQDEGHDQEPGARRAELDALRVRFERFNRAGTLDPA